MFFELWTMLKKTVLSFIEDEALSRGAAIAFYTVPPSPRFCSSWLRSPASFLDEKLLKMPSAPSSAA